MANQDGGFISQLVSHALGLNLFGGSSEVVNNGEDASIDNTLSRETRQADRNDLYAAASGGGVKYQLKLIKHENDFRNIFIFKPYYIASHLIFVNFFFKHSLYYDLIIC